MPENRAAKGTKRAANPGPCPESTYRLQVHAGFTLDDAAAAADYIAALGISHVYLSPYLQAASGSTHGYDPVDPRTVNTELGGEEAHQRFCRRLGELGLGQVLDIVPNHMAVAANNRYWWDILENGSSSRYANYFDIDWQPTEARLQNKMLVPVLADQYGVELDRGAIQVGRKDVQFEVCYGEHRYPVSPESVAVFLQCAAKECKSDTLAFLAESFARLPQPRFTERQETWGRHRDKEALFGLLQRCCAEETKSYACIDSAIKQLNDDKDALDAFLQRQNYRLAYWRTASEEIGYRRFFDVNTLIGVRVEREQVFLETHERILEWLRSGTIDGVRVDHSDGLRDPRQYFERLRKTAPHAYVIAEKILQREERLPQSWPIHGTTGYEFIDQANGLLLCPEGLARVEEIYRDFTGESTNFAEVAHEKKLKVEQEGLGSDVTRLTSIFVDICENDRNHRDYTRPEIRRAVREIAANFAVYRTYVSPDRKEISAQDEKFIYRAIAGAKQSRTDIDARLFDFIGEVLTLRRRGTLESEFLLRFQQFTSPVMAKGVEDTAFYCFNRLIALNDVGCEAALPAVTIEAFHERNAEIQSHHPLRMVALTTHDTKRSEDCRARILTLAEFAEEFAACVHRWMSQNRKHCGAKGEGSFDRNTEWFYYQTLVGAWPLSEERALIYMEKAVREAKVHTSWTQRNEVYEAKVRNFVKATLADKRFTNSLERFVAEIDPVARVNSLAQTLLKHTVPGVPDLYQGSELWDYRLVDPDNRTPVDYALRCRLLNELQTMPLERMLKRMNEGLPKLWTIKKAFDLRKINRNSFGRCGTYTPVMARGERAQHAVAFLRGDDSAVLTPRLTRSVAQQWGDTTIDLPAGRWRNVFTGAEIEGGMVNVGELLAAFPVALLGRER